MTYIGTIWFEGDKTSVRYKDSAPPGSLLTLDYSTDCTKIGTWYFMFLTPPVPPESVTFLDPQQKVCYF